MSPNNVMTICRCDRYRGSLGSKVLTGSGCTSAETDFGYSGLKVRRRLRTYSPFPTNRLVGTQLADYTASAAAGQRRPRSAKEALQWQSMQLPRQLRPVA